MEADLLAIKNNHVYKIIASIQNRHYKSLPGYFNNKVRSNSPYWFIRYCSQANREIKACEQYFEYIYEYHRAQKAVNFSNISGSSNDYTFYAINS